MSLLEKEEMLSPEVVRSHEWMDGWMRRTACASWTALLPPFPGLQNKYPQQQSN